MMLMTCQQTELVFQKFFKQLFTSNFWHMKQSQLSLDYAYGLGSWEPLTPLYKTTKTL